MSLRFPSLVLVILLPGLLLMTGSLVIIGQRTFEQLTDTNIVRDFKHVQTLMALMIDDRMQYGARELDSGAHSQAIVDALESGIATGTRNSLNQILESSSGQIFDRLVLERDTKPSWVEVDFGLVSGTTWTPRSRAQSCGTWLYQSQEIKGKTRHSLVYCADVLSKVSGRVIGRLHGGLLLNDNIPLLLNISHAIGVENLALRSQEEVIVSLSELSSDAIGRTVTSQPSLTVFRQNDNVVAMFPFAPPLLGTSNWQAPLEVVAIKNEPTKEGLEEALINNAYLAVLAIIVLGALMTFVLHYTIQTSLKKLMQYVKSVGAKQARIEAPSSVIYEYNQLGQVLSVMVDSLRRSEESLVASKDEAEKANKAKSEFLASMSHELRTPLNAVLGFAQMLQYDPKHPLAPVQNEHVENILTGGHHLLDLIDEVLELAKIEADQFSVSLEEVDPSVVIDECIALAKSLSAGKGINVESHIDKQKLLPLMTDRMRFKQILVNLLSNAIKFNNNGGTVTLDGGVTQNGYLRLMVTDTGIGIAPEDRDNVFQLFHRIGADHAIAREGTGIGLTITKQITERMAGSIGVESEVGVGSTFWFELPLSSNEDVLIWTDTMNTGVDAIDTDHRILTGLLNKITGNAVPESQIGRVVDELVKYTHYHFTREETIMEICDYPELKAHHKIHVSIAAQVNQLAEDWRQKGDVAFLKKLHKFLRDWLFNHIIHEDTKITRHAKGKKREINHALDVLSSLNHVRK